MRRLFSLSLSKVLITVAAILTVPAAFAGEQVLEFKLVTFRLDPTVNV